MKIQRASMMMICMIIMSTGTSCRSPVEPSPHGMIQEDFCQHPIVGVEVTLGDEARGGLTADELDRFKSMSSPLACREPVLCWEEH